jgi:hypothetical protein
LEHLYSPSGHPLGPTERRLVSSIDIETPEFARRAAFRNLSREKSAMKVIEWMFGVCVLVAPPIRMAEGGQCTAEIENLTKLLASRDAGSGPTGGGAASTTIGQHPPQRSHGRGGPEYVGVVRRGGVGSAAASAHGNNERGHPGRRRILATGWRP